MHFERIDLKAFGRFTDQSIDLSAGPHRFHLVYGRNESGKSTTMRAINSLLFGFPVRTNDDYVHRSNSLRVGARIVEGGRALEIVRHKRNKRTLTAVDESEEIPESSLAEFLGGITETEFTSRFALSHDELVAGGRSILAGHGDLGQILFAAGAGLGQLRDIQSKIESDSKELFSSRASKAAINQALSTLDEKRTALRKAQVLPSRFAALKKEVAVQQAVVQDLEKRFVEYSARLERSKKLLKAVPLLPEWRAAEQAMLQSADVIDLDDAFIERRRETSQDLNFAQNRIKDLTQQISEVERNLQSMSADPAVLIHESEIQSLFQEISVHDKADIDAKKLSRPFASVLRKMIASLRELSIEIETSTNEDIVLENCSAAIDRILISETNARRIIELAQQHGELFRDEQTARIELAELEKEFEALQAKQLDVTEPTDITALDSLMRSIGDPQDLVDHWMAQMSQRDHSTARCESILKKLDGFTGTIEEAAALDLPSETDVDGGERAMRESYDALCAAQSRLAELIQQGKDLVASRDAATLQDNLPTESELLIARQQRDLVIDELKPETVQEKLSIVQRRIMNADQTVDTMRRHHEQVNRLRVLQTQIDQTQAQLGAAEEVVSKSEVAFNESKAAWRAMWDHCGVVASKSERMRAWRGDHQALCELMRTRDHQQKEVDAAAVKIDRALQRLMAAIPEGLQWSGSQGLPTDTPNRWIQTVDRVTAALRRHEKLCVEFQEKQKQWNNVRTYLPQLRHRFAEAQQAFKNWQIEWKSLTSAFEDGKSEPGEMVERLARITDLSNHRNEANVLVQRKHAIGENAMVFGKRVQRLAINLKDDSVPAEGPGLDLAQATSAAQQWFARLQAERSLTQSRTALSSQLETLTARKVEAEAQCRHFESILEELCKEAGCASADGLPERERAARQRRRDVDEHRSLRNNLLMLCGDDTIEVFIERVSEQSPAMLEIEIKKTQQELDELQEQLSSANQTLGALNHEASRIDGSTAAAALSQDMQLLIGKLSGDVARYTRYRVASLLLRQSIEHYRLENQSPVLKLAEETFSELTLGKYRGLSTDDDAKGNAVLCAVPSDGGDPVPVSRLSTGTADALYLTLRLASLRHHLRGGKAIPLIVDDCLVQLDDQRSIAAIRNFSRLSRQTQVIMFTHHEHLIELAKQNLKEGEFHVHDLASRHAPESLLLS
jgi:uncharacterized protein YhaN